jgi:hypothetical protein
METQREKKEHVIFSLVREFLPHDDDATENVEPLSERTVYKLLALVALVVGMLAGTRWTCVNE